MRESWEATRFWEGLRGASDEGARKWDVLLVEEDILAMSSAMDNSMLSFTM